MKQLTQKLKDGQIKIINVPVPVLRKGNILVRNHYSLISSGTEASTVITARKSYIGKAKERPQQFKKVIESLETQGPIQTYRAVMKKLDVYSPLGYSSAGEVIDVAPDVAGYTVGDLVACGGLSACHAEIVSVPTNLCVKLKPDVDLKQAAYNTLGAISLHGIRQSGLQIGESCAIIGLGLLGQITALILKTSGIKVIGIDIDPAMVKLAQKSGIEFVLQRDEVGIENKIIDFTGGLGSDSVIITAASSSLDPINFAGAISRKKGSIVIVGAVPTGFDRDPHFYKKELKVKMSCSYGPGRYDPNYEEKGIDYPPAYVRWTENRNMQAFQELIYNKIIDVSYLTTHTFSLDDACKAYEMIIEKSEPFIGILIEYDTAKKIKNKPIFSSKPKAQNSKPSAVKIGFIGAGSYAQAHLLPNIPHNDDVSLKGVMTSTGTSSRSVADRYGFDFCTTDEKDIIENDDINTIFIATRHDSHANYVMKALNAGKHVFVEKPLCLSIEQLDEIAKLFAQGSKDKGYNFLMVGYNRRFSPLIRKVKNKLGHGPMAIIYRINAGAIPIDSWYQDLELGGGRIVGEICHFVDTLSFLTKSLIVSVYATSMSEPNNLNDTLNISLKFQNGSIGTISYLANGDKSFPKERIEIFAHGATAIIDDFKDLTFYSKSKKKKKKLIVQDKGQKEEVKSFIKAINGGKIFAMLTPFEEIYNTSLVTFKIVESIRTGNCIKIIF